MTVTAPNSLRDEINAELVKPWVDDDMGYCTGNCPSYSGRDGKPPFTCLRSRAIAPPSSSNPFGRVCVAWIRGQVAENARLREELRKARDELYQSQKHAIHRWMDETDWQAETDRLCGEAAKKEQTTSEERLLAEIARLQLELKAAERLCLDYAFKAVTKAAEKGVEG